MASDYEPTPSGTRNPPASAMSRRSLRSTRNTKPVLESVTLSCPKPKKAQAKKTTKRTMTGANGPGSPAKKGKKPPARKTPRSAAPSPSPLPSPPSSPEPEQENAQDPESEPDEMWSESMGPAWKQAMLDHDKDAARHYTNLYRARLQRDRAAQDARVEAERARQGRGEGPGPDARLLAECDEFEAEFERMRDQPENVLRFKAQLFDHLMKRRRQTGDSFHLADELGRLPSASAVGRGVGGHDGADDAEPPRDGDRSANAVYPPATGRTRYGMPGHWPSDDISPPGLTRDRPEYKSTGVPPPPGLRRSMFGTYSLPPGDGPDGVGPTAALDHYQRSFWDAHAQRHVPLPTPSRSRLERSAHPLQFFPDGDVTEDDPPDLLEELEELLDGQPDPVLRGWFRSRAQRGVSPDSPTPPRAPRRSSRLQQRPAMFPKGRFSSHVRRGGAAGRRRGAVVPSVTMKVTYPGQRSKTYTLADRVNENFGQYGEMEWSSDDPDDRPETVLAPEHDRKRAKRRLYF